MHAPRLTPIAIAASLVTQSALAMDANLTSAGYTGLGVTPSAHVLDWGRVEAGYENQVAGNVRRLGGHNAVVGFGVLPGLELTGRLATNTIHDNCFTTPCGARDLSASAKVGVGLDAGHRWRAAVGATDVGGSVTYFRTLYGVVTYDQGSFQASAGAAKRSGNGVSGSKAPLGGAFAALAWQPVAAVRAHVESADGNAWAGLRLFAPEGWLPEGWQLSLGANARLNRTALTERTSWSANLSIPLYKVAALPGTTKAALPPLPEGAKPLPAYEARVPAPLAGTTAASPSAPEASTALGQAAPPAPASARAPDPVSDDLLRNLADDLEQKGLEDIFVGRLPDRSVAIRVNNGSYRANSVDALGVALGVIARILSPSRSGFKLTLTQSQLPLVAVSGQADCLRQWIEQPANNCTAGDLRTPGSAPLEPLHDGVAWVVDRQRPAWQTVRIAAGPALRTNLGTELGAYDYALGAAVSAQLPLWSGASADGTWNIPLAHSDDYRANGVFGDRRIRSGTERLTVTQLAKLPLERWFGDSVLGRLPGAFTAQATVGRIGTFYDGALGALRWEPGEGRHRLSAQAGRFENNDFRNGFGPLGTLRKATPALASYRYSVLPTRTDLEVTGGRFLNNDSGVQVGMKQWFADVSLSLYYRRTAFDGQPYRQFAGIELSLPIGPRRDAKPLPFFQVGGLQRFSHRVETTVGEKAGNPLRTGYGVVPPAQDLDSAHNSDRSSLVYFEDNLRRIRDAARAGGPVAR